MEFHEELNKIYPQYTRNVSFRLSVWANCASQRTNDIDLRILTS
jgi:hypothetical protein